LMHRIRHCRFKKEERSAAKRGHVQGNPPLLLTKNIPPERMP